MPLRTHCSSDLPDGIRLHAGSWYRAEHVRDRCGNVADDVCLHTGIHSAEQGQRELPLFTMFACIDGRNVADDVCLHSGIHSAEQAQCELPLLTLFARTDGRNVADDVCLHSFTKTLAPARAFRVRGGGRTFLKQCRTICWHFLRRGTENVAYVSRHQR